MAHENQTVEPTAGPSTPPVVGTIAASLEQLSIGRLRGPVRTLAMFEVAPPARYNLDASPARTSTTNRFWVAAPADDTKLTPPTEPNPPPDPSPKGKARARPAPPLAVLAAAEFAELRVALQRAQLPGAAGDVAAGIADLGCFLDGGRQRARFVGVRVPPCVAADGPVVLGRAVARIPGPLEQFAVFCLVLPPPSRRRMPVPSASSIAKVAKWVRDDASSSLSHVFLHLAMAHGVSVRPLGPPPSAHAMALLAGLEALRGDWDDAVEKLVLYEYFASGREADINDNFRLAERTNIKGLSPDLIRVESPSSKQLCRVLGYLERLRTSDSPLDPPQDALHILQDTLAACVPSAKVEEGERKAWLDWVATTKIKQLIIGWAFADGADGAHWVLVWDVGGDLRSAVWRVLDDSAQKLTDAFVHIALGVAGLCTRVAWARDESQWFVTLLPGLESLRGRRVPGDTARRHAPPPKPAEPTTLVQLRVPGPSNRRSKPSRARASAKQAVEKNQPTEGTTEAHTGGDESQAVVADIPKLAEHEDEDNDADDEDDQVDNRSLVGLGEDQDRDIVQGVSSNNQPAGRSQSSRNAYTADIDDAAHSHAGSRRPLSPTSTDSEGSSYEPPTTRPLALMRRLGSSPATPVKGASRARQSSTSSSEHPLAQSRRLASIATLEHTGQQSEPADLCSDVEIAAESYHSTTSSVLSSTTSSPTTYGYESLSDPDAVPNNDVAGSSSSEDVPLAAVRGCRTAATDNSDDLPACADPMGNGSSSSRNAKRNRGSDTSEDEPLALARAFQGHLSMSDDEPRAVAYAKRQRLEAADSSSSDERPLALARQDTTRKTFGEVESSRGRGKKPSSIRLQRPTLNLGPSGSSSGKKPAPSTAVIDVVSTSDDEAIPLSLAVRQPKLALARKRTSAPSGSGSSSSSNSSSSSDEPLATQAGRKRQRRAGTFRGRYGR